MNSLMRKGFIGMVASGWFALYPALASAVQADVQKLKSIYICTVLGGVGVSAANNKDSLEHAESLKQSLKEGGLDPQAFVDTAYDQFSKILTDAGLQVIDPSLVNKYLSDVRKAEKEANSQAQLDRSFNNDKTKQPSDADIDAKLANMPPGMREMVKAQMKTRMAALPTKESAQDMQKSAMDSEGSDEGEPQDSKRSRGRAGEEDIHLRARQTGMANECGRGALKAPVNSMAEKLTPSLIYKDNKFGIKENTPEGKKMVSTFLEAVDKVQADGFVVFKINKVLNASGEFYGLAHVSASFYDKEGNNLWNYSQESISDKMTRTWNPLETAKVSVPEGLSMMDEAWQRALKRFPKEVLNK